MQGKLTGLLRKRLTYANVTATLALVLALGTGTAAASYLISSARQIRPSVRNQLKAHAYGVFNDDPGFFSNGGSVRVATLSNLPKGAYFFSAKIYAGIGGADQTVTCTLQAANDFDKATTATGNLTGGSTFSTLPMLVTHTFTSPGGSATVTCQGSAAFALQWAKLYGIRLGSEVHTAVTG